MNPLSLIPGMGPVLGFIKSPWGMAIIGALLFALYTGFIWVKAASYVNARWEVKIARATAVVEAKAEARNKAIAAELQGQVDAERVARELSENRTKELQDAILNDKGDTRVVVSPQLERVFDSVLGSGGGNKAPETRRPGQP